MESYIPDGLRGRYDSYQNTQRTGAQQFGSNTTNEQIEQFHADTINNASKRYQETYMPQEEELAAQLNDRSIINDAKANANSSFDGAAGRAQRAIGRYGIQQNAAQRQYSDRGEGLRRARNYVDQVNNANLDQYDRNIGLRDNLINIGQGIQADSLSQQGNQAASATGRINNHETASTAHKAQRRASNSQLLGSGLMLAAMFL